MSSGNVYTIARSALVLTYTGVDVIVYFSWKVLLEPRELE